MTDYDEHDDDDFIDLTTMEQECILYRMGDFPWVIENLMMVHHAPDICAHVMMLCDMVESGIVPKEMCQMSKDIFRLCVEKSDWLEIPEKYPDHPCHPISVMKRALRSVAGKLEEAGVEIVHLPG